MRNLLSVILLFIITYNGFCQKENQISISNSSYFSSAQEMPFWFWVNQNGKIDSQNSLLSVTEFNLYYSNKQKKSLRFFSGTNLIGGLGKTNYFQINQLFVGMDYHDWILKAGTFQNPIIYNGLSSTNGDFHWSNNIRPIPRIQLSTNGFINIPFFSFFPEWLKINVLYNEGLLNDKTRYVNAHLHHKHLLFGLQLNSKSFLTLGLDHYSMWGGVHPSLGKLPGSFIDYFRYILGLPGSDEFIKGDQNLMAGNQLGKYVVRFNQNIKDGKIEFYLNHPFTDRMDYSNYKDNLIGVFYNSNSKKVLTSVLYEFMYTNHQRVKQTQDGYIIPNGSEPYFMHGTYKSGMSYNNQMIGTPFAIPLIIIDDLNYGTGNNRIILHHLGLSGFFAERLGWKSVISFSENFGTFRGAYNKIDPSYFETSRKQLSILSEVFYNINNNLNLKIAVAKDKGAMVTDNFGVQLKVLYKFLN
jgi:hypothetical protein